MSKDKFVYDNNHNTMTNKRDFAKTLIEKRKVKEINNNKENLHIIVANSKKSYLYSIIEFRRTKYFFERPCASHTKIRKFKQNKKYLFLVGDPYEFIGLVRGIVSFEYGSVRMLVI